MAVGGPMICHMKEGAFEKNIWQEHISNLVNDEFIQIILGARETIAAHIARSTLMAARHIQVVEHSSRERLGLYTKPVVPCPKLQEARALAARAYGGGAFQWRRKCRWLTDCLSAIHITRL